MQNPNFHDQKQNTDEVMGFCRLSVFDELFTHFHDQLYSWYEFIIILVCEKIMSMIHKKYYKKVILCNRFCKTGKKENNDVAQQATRIPALWVALRIPVLKPFEKQPTIPTELFFWHRC